MDLARAGAAPLVEVALELAVPRIAWAPDLGAGGLAGMFDTWLAGFCQVGATVKRLDSGEGALGAHAVMPPHPTCSRHISS